MNDFNVIADGSYVREHRQILIDLGSWSKMTSEEKSVFKMCRKCTAYNEYMKAANAVCPCNTCEHRKTEIQIDNLMKQLRRKYL